MTQDKNLAKAAKNVEFFIKTYLKDYKTFSGESLKIYKKQKEVLKSWNNENVTKVLTSRQSGMTTLGLVFLLHKILFNTNYTCSFVAADRNMLNHCITRLEEMIKYLPKDLAENVFMMRSKEFFKTVNNSYILFYTQYNCSNNVRGKTFDHVIFDQPDFYQPENLTEILHSIKPCMSYTKGKLIYMGTPSSKDGFLNSSTDEKVNKIIITYKDVPWQKTKKWLNGFKELVCKRVLDQEITLESYLF